MCIPNKRLLPLSANNGETVTFNTTTMRWETGSPFLTRDNPEVINGDWLFNAPITYSGGNVDPFGVASPDSGFTLGADIDGHMFIKNSIGGIITIRTASISGMPIYTLPDDTGTMALKGKTGIHFDSDADISGTLQYLKDPSNNNLPIQLSTSLVLITSTLSVDNDIRIHNNLGYGIKSANDQRVMNIYNGVVTSSNTNWVFGHTSASARHHVRGDGTNPVTRWENSTGSLFWGLSSDATTLLMGGNTSAFPAIKRNGTSIELILGNGSGYAGLVTGAISVSGYGFVQLSTRYFIDQDSRGVAFGASVAIKGGNSAPDASSILDVESTGRGVLIPRMTTVQRDAIGAPRESLRIYNTTTKQHQFWNGATWKSFLTD